MVNGKNGMCYVFYNLDNFELKNVCFNY